MVKRLLFVFPLVLALSLGVLAQEVEVDRYTIAARIDTTASAVDVRAALALTNLGSAPKPKLYLRLTKLAKVSGATVGGAPAQVETADDRRVTGINQIIITPQTPLAPGASASLDIGYRIEAPESSGLIAIYPAEVVMAPESLWVPMPSTVFTLYGPTTAPFTLTVTPGASGLRAASAGAAKADAGGQSFTFEQPLNSLPFFIAGKYDQPITADHGGVKIEIYVQPGLANEADPKAPQAGSSSRAGLARLSEEAGRIIDFLTRALGPPPAGATFRIISSVRAGHIAVPGALVLNEMSLHRGLLDTAAIERLADAIARIWTDGRTRVRGQEARTAQADRPAQKGRSAALLRDSLPRYLAALYFEDRFGKEAGREAFARMRWTYTPVAQSGRDAEMAVQTIALPNYTAAVFGKGPLVLRLLAETGGRDKFLAAVGQLLSGSISKVVTVEDLRKALSKDGGAEGEKLFQQWVDSITEPDIIIGVPTPSDRPGAQRVNLRNLGTGEVTVPVLAITASGKQSITSVKVPSEDLTTADIATAEKIDSVEVDPDKLIIQTNYDNDRKPVRLSAQTLFNESIVAFNKGEHAQAEAKLRDALGSDPHNSLLRAWLARSLAAQNKTDEAVKEAEAVIKATPPVGSALAWAHITLGQIALARNQAAEAAQHLRRAVAEAEEAPAQFAARDALARAERAANMSATVDDSIRAFVAQLDTAIKQPASDKLFALIIRNNLKRFVQGLTVSPPSAWATEILRVDQIDSNRVALDVGLKIKAGGRDQSGTALFILYRSERGWMLEDVQLFNVK